jgi:hypothetical protein
MPGIHWIALTETPQSTAIKLIHSLLANTQDRPHGALPVSWGED